MSNGDTENNTMDLTMNTKENNNNNTKNENTEKESNKEIDDLQLHDTLSGEKDAENNQNNVTDDTDVFLKPRQDSMSLYTNFMPRLSSATEMSIANFFNMETGNLNNTNNNKDNNSTTGTTTNTTASNSNNTKSGNKVPMDVNTVNRGYSIVNNNSQSSLYNGKARRQSVSHSGSVGLGVGNNNSNNNNNSTQEYNGARRQSEQLEPFVAPMKFKTPNFGSSTTSITNNAYNSKIKRSNSVTPGPTNIVSSKSKDQMGGQQQQQQQQPTGAGNTKQNNNTTISSSVGASGIQNTDPNGNNSPSLPPQLADLPSLRSDSISSILGAAALMNQPLQPPSKRNSFFIPTDSHTQLTQLQQQPQGQNQQQNQSSDQKTMKPPSTTAPVYHNKQQGLGQGQGQTQQQQQNQQFQNLMNSNSLSNFYSEGTPGAQNTGTDNIDFDIFNLNTSRKSSFRFGDDFDLSAFRRRDSSVRGTLDLPPLPGSSVGNRLRSSSRTFSQILNNPQLTVHPGTTTTSGSNMNQQNIAGGDHSNNNNNSNNNGSGGSAHSTHKNNNGNDHKSSQYSNFLKNHENAISDYDDDEDLDLHALPKNSGSHQLGGQSNTHSHQGTMDSRMILRRKSNLKDTSLTPIPLTTPPLTSFSHQLNQHNTQNQHSTHSNNGNSHVSHHISDPLGSLDVDSQIGGSPSIDFDMDGNIIGTHDFEPPTDLETVPKQSTSKSSSSKKSSSSSSSSSKKDKTKKSRKRKSSSSTEHGKEPEESKPKKRKSSKKSSSSKSSSTSEATETTSKKSSSSTSGSTNSSSSTSSSSSKSKKSKVKKETKPKSTRRTKKSTTSTDGETPSTKSTSSSSASSGTKKKKSSKSSTSTKKPSQKKSRASASAAAARAAESLMSQPIVVENPMKAKDGSNDSDGPVLGATRVDQLMLILQARQKGYTSALETTSDGKINIENAPEIIPPAIELVGGVDKPKTHDLLLNPPPAAEQNLPTPQEVSAQTVSTTETKSKAGKKGKASSSAGPNGKSVSVKVNSTSPIPSDNLVADGSASVDDADGTASQSGSAEATPTPSGRRKLHICQYCNKQFTQSTHLEVHVRSHIGLKPYECSYCGKTFTQGGNLRTHIRLHTGEQPFQCKVCGKKFSRKGNLQAHALTHEDFRPFRCILDGCDKSFTQLGNLKSHQNKFHLETLNILTLKLAKNDFDLNNEDERKLLEYLSSLYKNSNKGIKGRGKNSASVKNKDGLDTVSFPTGEPASIDSLPDATK